MGEHLPVTRTESHHSLMSCNVYYFHEEITPWLYGILPDRFKLSSSNNKIYSQGWATALWVNSVGEVFAVQAQRPEIRSPDPTQKLSMMVCTHNPIPGRLRQEVPEALVSRLAKSGGSRPMSDPVSKPKQGERLLRNNTQGSPLVSARGFPNIHMFMHMCKEVKVNKH